MALRAEKWFSAKES